MPSIASQGKELKSFLKESTLAYAEGGVEPVEVSPNAFVAQYEVGEFRLMDMYSTSPDHRKYTGREMVFRDDERIWEAAYHGVISATIEPEDFLESYVKALLHPRPQLPIRGPRSMRIAPKRRYQLGSVSGPLRVGDFAVNESMTQNGIRIYNGHITGGWMK